MSGNLFGLSQNAGMGWEAARLLDPEFLILSTHGGLRGEDGRPIALERSLFPAARFPGLLEFRLDGSLYELLEVKYGLRPHRAREILEPVTAGVREAEALDVFEGAPLMQVERTAYARSGEPLEFARDLFRGDLTRIVIWTPDLPDDI